MKKNFRIAPLFLVAILLLSNTGCLGGLIVAGVAATAAGGTAGYAYVRGEVPRDYPVDPARAEVAIRAALAELQFQEVRREREGSKVTFETKTPSNATVMLLVSAREKEVLADPTVTRISVRVGVFGDEALSVRILNTIDKYLVPAVPVVAQPASVNFANTSPPVETSVPPLATATNQPKTVPGQQPVAFTEPQPVPVTRK